MKSNLIGLRFHKKILCAIIFFFIVSGCYEYRKIPNIKRVKKKEVKKAMEYSTWKY